MTHPKGDKLRPRVGKKNSERQTLWGYVFILPSIIGLLVFFIGPLLFSLVVSFTDWNMLSSFNFIGADNYTRMLGDPRFQKSLRVTLTYALMSVPAVCVVALLVASLLNAKVRALSLFRTIFYLPSIVPMIANAALWMFIYNPIFGLANNLMALLGLPPQNWIYDQTQVIPALVVMSVWGCGNTIVVYLAGLQGISPALYEAVDVDGGNGFHKFMHITMPMISPIIFFNAIMGIIGSLQTFTQGYVMTKGGPNNASLFYILLLYRTAFERQQMGYASAMAWVLFVIIIVLTALVFRSSAMWVHYEGGGES